MTKHTIHQHWIECRVIVINTKMRDLGIDQGIQWHPFCLRIADIVSFRPDTEDGEILEDTTIVYSKYEDSEFTINVPYKILLEAMLQPVLCS